LLLLLLEGVICFLCYMICMRSALPAIPQHTCALRCTALQVVLGLGVAAASLYGLHQLLAPRITAWTQQLTASRRAAQDAEAERTAALTAALQSLSEGQQKLLSSVEGLAAALQQQQQQQQRPGSSQAVRVMGGSAAYGGPGEAQSSISFHQQRVTYDEQLRCQSPGAAAAAGMGSSQRQQQQQQQQYSGNVRGWDPCADPSQGAAIRSAAGYSGPGYSSASNYSQSQQQEGAASSVGAAAAGPAGGFEVVPRGMQPASDAMWGASSSSSAPARAGALWQGMRLNIHCLAVRVYALLVREQLCL
jgi:hypothetical protein